MEYWQVIILCFVVLGLCAIGYYGGCENTRHKFEKKAVDAGKARFNPQTKEFEWLEES